MIPHNPWIDPPQPQPDPELVRALQINSTAKRLAQSQGQLGMFQRWEPQDPAAKQRRREAIEAYTAYIKALEAFIKALLEGTDPGKPPYLEDFK